MPKQKKPRAPKQSRSQSLRIAVKISGKFSRVSRDTLGTNTCRPTWRARFLHTFAADRICGRKAPRRTRQPRPAGRSRRRNLRLFRMVSVSSAGGASSEELEKALRRIEMIEVAYVMRPGPPPVVNPANDPRSMNQGYLDAAPNGIDARYAWGFSGGDGAGAAFVDMEQGWNLNHEELTAAGITLMSGVSQFFFEHGTSVLGRCGCLTTRWVVWASHPLLPVGSFPSGVQPRHTTRQTRS